MFRALGNCKVGENNASNALGRVVMLSLEYYLTGKNFIDWEVGPNRWTYFFCLNTVPVGFL